MKRDLQKYKNSYKIIGDKNQKRRKSIKISQEELAFRVNSARNYVGCIERAEKVPSITILLDIAAALGCKLEDIVKNA